MDNQQEFNQQEYNKEMEKQLLAHGFEMQNRLYGGVHCTYTDGQDDIIEVRFKVDKPAYFKFSNGKSQLHLQCRANHSIDWVKQQANFYVGIDLVKSQEQEPLKCTLENAWKGRDRAYWISDRGEIVGRGLEQSAPPDSADFISKQDAEKATLIARVCNLIFFANEKFPAVEGQEWKYYNPFFDEDGSFACIGTDNIETQYAFASREAFRFFIAELKNVELLKKAMTPNL